MIKLTGLAQMNEKGQLVIPANFRKMYHYESGDKFFITEHDGGLVLTPVEEEEAKKSA